MEYLPLFLTVATVHLLAVVSPGPDFAMILRNTLMYSRRTGIYSALGLGLGILVHVTYSLVGIAVLISKTPLLFALLQVVGAIYLLYIGYQAITASAPHAASQVQHNSTDIGRFAAVRIGFLTNVLNPKATLFFLSLFTVVIQPGTPFGVKVLMGIEMALVTFLWFAFLAILLSHHHVKKRITRIQYIATKAIGIVLTLLGGFILFESTNSLLHLWTK